ncbi:pyrroline-5-carboxylate reductase [Paenibacillus swuensis]|uniref:Pyrroline-5-carboxylate reductase n=1 Tax=Paenibacillus swuensis TaxID=1178515 RepID=A0A172TLL7_9BACL|nr:pyrroline-5-carboxylate reductase [Paenibacillus swuensis]ANE47920.1 pyrroline-5-carboxylate reductase [Paenibacillus swuensis]
MSASIIEKRIAFYGAGSIAEALVRGLLAKQKAWPGNLSLLNRGGKSERLQNLRTTYGVRVSGNPESKQRFVQEADLIVLAVKPVDCETALLELKPLLNENQMIVSVVAGLTIETIEGILEMSMPVVRTMPNTSSTIGFGATGIAFSERVTDHQQQTALEMFESIGTVTVVEESLLNVVTGVSGSGPAYVYFLMEQLTAAGVQGGMDEETARTLTVQTFLGAAQMVQLTGEDPADLRRKVTSPNGTTQAALDVLAEYRFAEGFNRAVLRASERAAEMGATIGRK